LTVVEIPGGAAGITKPSVAVCHQVTTLGRAKLGALSPTLLGAVEMGLKTAIDLD